MKYLIALAVSAATLCSPAFAADCFGKNEFQGKITAGGPHPTFDIKVNFDSMTANVAGNEGPVTRAYCNLQDDGAKTIIMTISAHIRYTCQGEVSGGTSNTVAMTCLGDNTSVNSVTGRLLRF